MSNTLFEITLKNDKRIIPEVASFISDSAVKLGLSAKKANFLCFTIETALEYRVDAIDEKNPDIKVSVEDDGKYFKFAVTDLGEPYILTKNQQTILKRKLVDKYSFEQRGRKGQTFSFAYKMAEPLWSLITSSILIPSFSERISTISGEQNPPWHLPIPLDTRLFTPSTEHGGIGQSNVARISPLVIVSHLQITSPKF